MSGVRNDLRRKLRHPTLNSKLNEVSSLREITLIEDAKLLVRGAVSGVTCDCKTKCGTKHCPCRKVGVGKSKFRVRLKEFLHGQALVGHVDSQLQVEAPKLAYSLHA
ncbi:unnamed protein product [Didymodactylos carnosus]|uniref:Uncharacterized protein n=1 Tax=Didymodactylos carnosus TaxID=1234261 RepID=A0A814Y9L1_9BILA|nr:unnamed protein product [Didymodactylos carnosus]CAF3989709.1 unnamed protein product [Didymodactylos carnosus]